MRIADESVRALLRQVFPKFNKHKKHLKSEDFRCFTLLCKGNFDNGSTATLDLIIAKAIFELHGIDFFFVQGNLTAVAKGLARLRTNADVERRTDSVR